MGPPSSSSCLKKTKARSQGCERIFSQPVGQVGFRVVGTAQTQIAPIRRADDLARRLLVGILQAKGESSFPEEIGDAGIEPGGAPEVEGAAGTIGYRTKCPVVYRGAVAL